ncbi:MAG: tRNA lysidine(34) synthetase TilS [Flavobacteriaceae bacterium]|nr:tRNA lysidine(34) synthetase TilS [Flavobacteriaceae bacterium]|tara:strand:+ start:131983 stop:133305 length:1323 start_codon:yes stop_codon:yes gene_type:complete
MLDAFKLHIEQHFPFLKNKRLLVGVSGGIDSVVLSFLLSKLNFDITVAHCNFKLRGTESDDDEEFVKELKYVSPNQILTKVFDTESYAKEHKLSIQVAARELRYKWFQELQNSHGFDYIATAHNADDNLETFLINLTRGSGLDGFTGIPEVNANIIRPLLRFSRKDISSFAAANNIQWREDSSNASTKYVRNKLRHKVIPTLKEINPQLLDSFSNTLKYLNQTKEVLNSKVEEMADKVISKKQIGEEELMAIDIAELQKEKHAQLFLFEMLKSYHFTAWEDIYNLLDSQSGKQIFSESHRLLKDRGLLLLSKINKNSDAADSFQIHKHQLEIHKPIQLQFGLNSDSQPLGSSCILVDKDLLKYPLTVRKWKNGDYFYPTGMQGKKKVSKYFKDEKFSLIEKDNTWILANGDDEIIWIVNHRQDRRFEGNKSLRISFLEYK